MDIKTPSDNSVGERDDTLIIDIPSLDDTKTNERHEDLTREKLALRITSMVGAIIALAIVSVALFPNQATTIKDIVVSVVPELIVVLGTVIGFYFGAKRK